MKISYNWLKWYIPDAPDAQKLHDVLTYHLTEVEGMETLSDGDVILDINILPNRAHDLLSHSGVARELSGQLGIPFTDPTKTYTDILAKKEIQKTNLTVEIKNESARRYSARIIRNIKVGPSPEWVVKHLESVGQRSINNIVDATNLVMLNCGQPTHAFDLRKFPNQQIIVTEAQEGEKLELVGREKIVATLKDTDIVIANIEGESLALGGVKGGANSGIEDTTTDIVIEVANFNPSSVRKTARRIGALSDAAKRFENDLSPELCDFGMLELTALLIETNPDAVIEDIVDVYPHKQEERSISFTTDFVNKKVGGTITTDEVVQILKINIFSYKNYNGSFEVVVPSLRLYLENPIDMVEEIGRIYGYDKVTPVIPKIDFSPKENSVYEKMKSVRSDLLEKGYCEVMTYSFTNTGDVEVLASASDKNFLRTNLLDGLKKSYELNRLNAPLLGQNEVKIFEIGTVFLYGVEEIHVAYVDKKESKELTLDQYSSSGSSPLVIDPKTNIFTSWSSYPFITRDISVWLPVDMQASVLSDIYAAAPLLAREPQLVDTFTKEGRVSYAYRLVFQAKDRTLTDTEVVTIMESITQNILDIEGAEIR